MLIKQLLDEDGVFVGGGGLGFEDEIFAGDAKADEIVGHGLRIATLFVGVFTLDDGAIGGDDEFADDAFMIELDSFGEAVHIAPELRTVALPIPVTATTEDDAVLVGLTGGNFPWVSFAPLLGGHLVDGFQAEKDGSENCQSSQRPLPSSVTTTEPCSYDEQENIECGGTDEQFHGDKDSSNEWKNQNLIWFSFTEHKVKDILEHRITSLRSLTHFLCSLRYVHERHKNVQR